MVKCIRELEGLNTKFKVSELYQTTNQDGYYVTVCDGNNTEDFTYEQMEKCFIQLNQDQEFELLKQAAQPMIDYLKKFYNPMTSAVINEGYVKIVVEEIGMPLKVRD